MTTHHHDHDHGPSDQSALRAEALESLLIEKGLVTPEAIDAIIRAYEEEIGPMNGAKVIARAWADADYRRRLLENPKVAVEELGLDGLPEGMLQIVENRPGVHNVIVCTLCSCYPSRLLGISPSWYKEPAYRSRVVREPRHVLKEMGLELEQEVEIRVWDSSAEMRYMVLPERPPGTDGWSEEALAALVTRDAMIGVARVKAPADGTGAGRHE
jgi:nitrile hydratase